MFSYARQDISPTQGSSSGITGLEEVAANPCFIERLPPELIEIIFFAARDQWLVFSPGQNVHGRLLHVCRRWRNIALDIPYLWNSIGQYEDLESYEHHIHLEEYPLSIVASRMEEWISRARGVPLDAIFTSMFFDTAMFEPLICRALSWRSLQFHGSHRYQEQLHLLFDCFLEPSYQLQEIYITMESDDTSTNRPTYLLYRITDNPRRRTISSFPNLHSLNIARMLPEFWQLHAPNLEYLSLYDCIIPVLSIVQISNNFPRLEHLHLERCLVHDNSKEVANPNCVDTISFPELETLYWTLYITGGRENMDSMAQLLPRWSQFLTRMTSSARLLPFWSAETLEHVVQLSIKDPLTTTKEIRGALEKLSSLKELTVECTFQRNWHSSNLVQSLGTEEDGSFCCPQLREIAFIGLKLDMGLLVSVLRSRQYTNIKVTLFGCFNIRTMERVSIDELEEEFERQSDFGEALVQLFEENNGIDRRDLEGTIVD